MCECECVFVSFPSCKLYFASTASLHNLLTIEWSTMKDTTLYVYINKFMNRNHFPWNFQFLKEIPVTRKKEQISGSNFIS